MTDVLRLIEFLKASEGLEILSDDTVLTDKNLLYLLQQMLDISGVEWIASDLLSRYAEPEIISDDMCEMMYHLPSFLEADLCELEPERLNELLATEGVNSLFQGVYLPEVFYLDEGEFIGESMQHATPRVQLANFLSVQTSEFSYDKLWDCDLQPNEVLAAAIGAYSCFEENFFAEDVSENQRCEAAEGSPLVAMIAIWTNFIGVDNPFLGVSTNTNAGYYYEMFVPWTDMLRVSAWYYWFVRLDNTSAQLGKEDYSVENLFEDIIHFAAIKEVQND